MQIGIDIGGTNTVWALVDDNAKIIETGNIKTQVYNDINIYINAIYDSIISKNVNLASVKGIGIGAPNGNFYTGCIEFAPNLPWKENIPLAKLITEKFKLPCIITNDANAAAIGEMKFGAAKNMNDFIMITLGTGVGSGFVANGKLIYGHDGFAGELGHTIAVRDGRPCGCGRNGCLETYTSATGIVKTVKEFLKNNSSKNAHHLLLKENCNAYDIFQAAKDGDEMALEIFDFTGKILGQSLADAVAITSPEAIILFGGLANAGKFIFEPTKKYMELNLLKNYQNKVKLLPSQLPENNVAVLGAAALILN
ncbi:MAG: ROK family protein [Chitinophagaceae bacterium]|nr:ROK family protein [Chitinophagaceae bacterium]